MKKEEKYVIRKENNMTVKEYAVDINLSVAEVIKKCNDLGIEVKNGDDFLTDDDVIILDNEKY